MTVPLRAQDQRYVQFSWDGKFFQFRTLCFGLSIAPWAFTKLLKPIIAYLRALGVRLIVYLDDILIINSSKEGAEADFKLVKQVLESCGLLINLLKSVPLASQSIEFLGAIPDSRSMMLSLKISKLIQIQELCKEAVQSEEISLRTLSKILGNLSWAVQAVPYAQSHFRGLQSAFNKFYHFQGHHMDTVVFLDPSSVSDLEWWRDNVVNFTGRSMEALKPDLVIYSDASLTGWGATLNDSYASGPWSREFCGKHINELELLAAFNGLKSFANFSSNISIHLMLDNATSVAYINKCGGTHSIALNQIALDIVKWSEERQLAVQAFHVPGKDNCLADYYSRYRTDSSDWRLDPAMFARIQEIWPVNVDLFASSWNKQLECFVSWKHQPESLAIDAFSLNWGQFTGYLFPPFCLIARCLSKVRMDQAEVTLVTPFWPTQAWFPLAVELTCDRPRLFPVSKQLLTGPRNNAHPLLGQQTFRLIAWRLSGSDMRRKKFRKTCAIFYSAATELERTVLTNPLGSHGIAGVANGRVIPYLHL